MLGGVAGLVSGTLGVGSGIILVPAFVLLFSMPQKSAQGTALAVMVPMALIGAIRYWVNPAIKVDLRIAGIVAVGAVAGALVGTSIVEWVPGAVLRRVFAVFMIGVAVKMLAG